MLIREPWQDKPAGISPWLEARVMPLLQKLCLQMLGRLNSIVSDLLTLHASIYIGKRVVKKLHLAT